MACRPKLRNVEGGLPGEARGNSPASPVRTLALRTATPGSLHSLPPSPFGLRRTSRERRMACQAKLRGPRLSPASPNKATPGSLHSLPPSPFGLRRTSRERRLVEQAVRRSPTSPSTSRARARRTKTAPYPRSFVARQPCLTGQIQGRHHQSEGQSGRLAVNRRPKWTPYRRTKLTPAYV